jgi:holliday junction DNA helicase RuvB
MFRLFNRPPDPPPYTWEDRVADATDRAYSKVINFVPLELLDEIAGAGSGARAFPPTDIAFKPGEPNCLFRRFKGDIEFRGQESAKALIDLMVSGMGAEERTKILLTGPAGIGKTTLALITALEIQAQRERDGLPRGDFYLLIASEIETKAELDAFMRQLQPYDTVFIDEIHTLGGKGGWDIEVLFPVLQDTGTPMYPLGMGGGMLPIPQTVSWIAATTERGATDPTTGGALLRRFDPVVQLENPDEAVLADILLDRQTPIDVEAAWAIAERSSNLPWQALSLYDLAVKAARRAGRDTVSTEDAELVFKIRKVDENGLFEEDRAVIRALLMSETRKLSQSAVMSMAGVDEHSYKSQIQPKLLRRGLLTIRGGQALTEKAVEEYGHLVHG